MSAPAPHIGVFDSGIGGLSVLRALRAHLPAAHITYLADNAWAPYGERDPGQLRARILGLIQGWHARAVPDLLVIACNSATAVAIDALRQALPDLPQVGIEPALRPALAATRSGEVGVLATRATLDSDRYRQLRMRCLAEAPSARLCEQAGDGLADAIEQGDADRVAGLADRHIGALRQHCPGLDVLVLGCTHYPLASGWLQAAAGPSVLLVDPADAVARRAAAVLGGRGVQGPSGTLHWRASGPTQALRRAAAQWLGLDAADVGELPAPAP